MKRPTPRQPQREEAEPDATFYDRADAVIDIANKQLADMPRGKVSASTLYAAARFNAWVSATGWHSADELRDGREETIEYFVKQYRSMLAENLDDYIDNFEQYMRRTN